MPVLPSIKAKYDNYIHLTILNMDKSMLHVCTQYFTCIYMSIMVFYSFVLMMLSSPESEKSMRSIPTVFIVLHLNCIG